MGDLVLLLGVGDTHGDFAPLLEAARREPDARAILQVGDLTAGKAGREEGQDDDPAMLARLPVPLVWVHGNHEHWELLGLTTEERTERKVLRAEADRAAPDSVLSPQSSALGSTLGTHLWAGDEYVVPGTQICVVGLPGNFAPNWYEREKPFPGDRVRHFNSQDVQALARFEAPSVLLMHEAFRGQAPGRIGYMGVPVLAQLVRRLRPKVVLTGHHHIRADAQLGPTLAIALPRAQEGYARLFFQPSGDLATWEFVHFQVA